MDLEKEKNQPMQNELELDFNTVEPITPKKSSPQPVPFFIKLKQLFRRQSAPVAETVNVQTQISSEQTMETEAEVVSSNNWKKPETWRILSPLPQRHRRLFVALFALVLLFILYFLLKPSQHTVTAFEQQNSNAVPIQFQPIDKSQEEAIEDNANLDQLVNQLQEQAPAVIIEPVPTEMVSTHTEPMPQVDNTQSAVKPKPVSKPLPPPPTVVEPKTTKPTAIAEKNAANLKTRTLTIPQGVSLMQVFRNQNLNIAEVNAMTKAKGANNVLSSFKGGDKVKVLLNNKGNVVELQLQNGSKFIRQKDGSYQFKK